MYESFYALKANPFRLVPDARFYYASSGHKRGLAYLRYGLHQGQGFVVVTGRPGTGKSTLVQTLFSELRDRQLIVASLTSTNLGATDILQAVGNSFDVYGDASNKASLLIAIENFLKAKARQGKHVILIVDEAHNLPKASLEELRMLSNFQLGDKPLLQIMLLGQHQLPEILARPDMEQLSQRVIASCHLQPMNKDETRAYIGHRLQCVGWQGDPSISAEAIAVVYVASTGIPRLINVFCDRMLLAASLDGKHAIDLQLAKAVLLELQQEATGTFSSVTLEIDDLIGFEPLPGDDFLFVPASVEVAETRVPSDEASGHNNAAVQVDEQGLVDNSVATVDDKQNVEMSDYEPGFANDTDLGSTADTREQGPLPDDSGDVIQPEIEPVWRPDFNVEQVKQRKKVIIIIIALVVVLMFVLLFIFSGNRQLPGASSSADIAMQQQSPTEKTQPPESLPVVSTADRTELANTLIDADAVDSDAELNLPLALEAIDTGFGKDRSAAMGVMDIPVAADDYEGIEEFAPPEMLEPESQQVANNPVAVAKTDVAPRKVDKPVVTKKTKQVVKEGEKSISDSELTTLVVDMINFYETGNVKKFSALFAKDAVANGMNGVSKIRKDYKRLFLSTDKRKMRVDNMKWRHEAGKASGRGVFAVSVWKKEGLDPLLQQGELNIELIRNKDKLLITNLSHELN